MSNQKKADLFKTLNIGDAVIGEWNGLRYSGIITAASDTRKPRGAGVDGYTWEVRLSEPVTLYGVTRDAIRVRLFTDENSDDTITAAA